MQNESEIFLPSSNTRQNNRRHHNIPCLSSHLFKLFEENYFYALFTFLLFTFSILIGLVTTYDEYTEDYEKILIITEFSLSIYCFIEFLLRIYGSESKIRYKGFSGKAHYFYEHYLIVDFILLISYLVVFILYFTEFYDPSKFFLHSIRFLQVLRFIPLDRYIKSIPLIFRIIWQYRGVLISTINLCFMLLLPTAYILWFIERSIPTDGKYFFKTYSDALWFTVNSMATIGYGDTWPQTLLGRIITSTLCCVGVVLWTLPAGIISTGLTSIEEKRRERERLRQPAARLIFAWWRLNRLNCQTRAMSNKYQDKQLCKQFIARLTYARHCREFRQCRYGLIDCYDVQMKKDIDRIHQCLKAIENKLTNSDQKLLEL